MKHTVEELEQLPTLAQGQADNLKIDGDADGLRVWLSRCGPEDGVDDPVSYEKLTRHGWRSCDSEGNPL